MAGKRNYEWPLAVAWDSAASMTQDKPGGSTESVTPALVEAKLEADGFPKIPSPTTNNAAVYGPGGWSTIKLTNTHIDASAAIGWTKISKSGAVAGDVGAEPALGNPGAGNWFLKTVNAVRSWVQLGALAFKNDFADIMLDPVIGNPDGLPYLNSYGQIPSSLMTVKLNSANPDFSGSLKQSAVERISATGKFLGVGLNLTNGTANAIPKFDGSKDLVASGLSDDGTTVAVARNQLKAGAGLNSALFSWAGGSPVACWGHSTGALDPTKHAIAQNQNWGTSVNSAAGQDLAFTIGNVVKAQLLADGAFKFVGLAGTGTRPVAVDSTGKLVVSGGENSFAVKSSSFTLSASTERVIRTQGAITVTLPSASSLQGYSYTFLQEQVGGGALTFFPPEPWFSSVSAAAWVEHAGSWGFSIAWRRADLTSDGLNWLATFQ